MPKGKTAAKFPRKFPVNLFENVRTRDIEIIDDLIQTSKHDQVLQAVPKLGTHYSHKWAQEDEEMERELSSHTTKQCTSAEVRKDWSKINRKFSKTSPLTTNLISRLNHMNVVAPLDSNCYRYFSEEDERVNSARATDQHETSSLERRLRERFEAGSILMKSEKNEPDENDEVLRELKRVQTDLQAITELNIRNLKCLRTIALQEIAKEEKANELRLMDYKLLDAHKKITELKKTGKSLRKEDINNIQNILNQRKLLENQVKYY